MKALLLAATLVLAAAGPVPAGAKKQSDVAIRFYAQGGDEGGEFSQKVELINSHRAIAMQSLPLVTEREITAFFPFQARDNSGTMGAYFKLDAHGSNLFSQHTMSRRGTYVLAFMNGRHVIDLYVDRAVTDGIITIPSGLSQHDIDRLELALPVIGQENIKPGSKKKAAPEAVATPVPLADLRLQPAMRRQTDGTLAPATASNASSSGSIEPRPLSSVGQ